MLASKNLLSFDDAFFPGRPSPGGGGVGLSCEKVGDAHQKIWIKPPKENNLGVA